MKNGHAIDLDDAKHVADLVRRGLLRLGKGGEVAEILRPGPRAPNAGRAIRWMMRGR